MDVCLPLFEVGVDMLGCGRVRSQEGRRKRRGNHKSGAVSWTVRHPPPSPSDRLFTAALLPATPPATMCQDKPPTAPARKARDTDAPLDWETIPLPPPYILSHLTDAHCHPTDLTHSAEVYDTLALGGLAAMATAVDDQVKVEALSRERKWFRGEGSGSGKGKEGKGVGVVACFGYHPWFTHRYTLSPPSSLPSKRDHYTSLFLQSASKPNNRPDEDKLETLLETLLPFLPDPIPLQPLLQTLRQNLVKFLEEGRLTMLGEVGLDASARLRWPIEARSIWEEMYGKGRKDREPAPEGEESEEWKRLTPFKVPISHQRAIVEAQMEIAIELGINISFHSVACAGPTMDVLNSMKTKHGSHFIRRVNVDLHSAGGWSPQFWMQAQKSLPNLYASPSIPITSRSPSAPSLIRAIARDRMLVESDSHDARLSTRYVWAATEWVGRLKGWKVEGLDRDRDQDQDYPGVEEDWELESEEEAYDHRGKPIDPAPEETWTVRTLERNWARFMRLLD
ncbi:hypothetical protein C351_03017 [Cryptococcus neoformans c8]|nr:hypothetical protein C353_03292 [Cryptococcus neoformans var. grubii AD1-83a]OXG59566.1 hypothetical protein C354_03228 [Cryptococcus neoformans var. grubii MW-RSA1955]OXG63345.1 hypothetical protein C351_03017 [Cryptococcus neoformans var. grubii c8]OXG64385.1 hypothetical protein C352_03239 [Cryptococcus neoformans var. grubii CHC193]